MPPHDGRLSGRAVRPLRRGVASSEAEMSYLLEGGSLPSSEAEMRGAVEGPDGSPRARWRLSRGPERGANGPHAASLSPLLSSRLEEGRGPLRAQLP